MSLDHNTDDWMSLMRSGEWEAAWRVCDRVLQERRGLEPRDGLTGEWLPRHLQWVWNGTPLDGKRILVHCYHGLGDTIQFIRFAEVLKKRKAYVTVWAQEQLLPLLQKVNGIDALLTLQEEVCDVQRDVDIEIMELPHALRTTLNTLPRATPYIGAERRASGRRVGLRPRVGLVWAAGEWDANRSILPELMGALPAIDEIDFVILQRGPALATWPARKRVEIPTIGNIMEEAAELRGLDLLLSVDTLSAHLAGALGVKTWTLLPLQADWRWMKGCDDTPWYPNMRLFRQARAGDWHAVIARVARALRLEFG